MLGIFTVSRVLTESRFCRKPSWVGFYKKRTRRKKIFFCTVKKFPQEIENTREIIKNMSEIIQNISDIFFAIYTPVDFQILAR